MVPPGDDVRGVRGSRPRLRGDAKPKTTATSPASAIWSALTKAVQPEAAPAPVSTKKRVLFVCIGNSCRSQMAEAFARAYGSDALWVQSAGLGPAEMVAPMTHKVLEEKGVRSGDQFPKGLDMMTREKFDLVVNMSGRRFTFPCGEMVEWVVRDPIGESAGTYRAVADQIEGLVMRLILDARAAMASTPRTTI
jgi:arsenate reductase (thioredoxin)